MNVKYLIGQFHVLPHGSACVRNMQPYTTKNNGLVDGEALERRWAFFRLHLHSWKQMTSENRAIFMERLIWWQYQEQSNNIIERIIRKHKDCVKKLSLIPFIDDINNQESDYVFINHSSLELNQSTAMRTIERLVLELHYLNLSKNKKVYILSN
jgi:hypothetical protein